MDVGEALQPKAQAAHQQPGLDAVRVLLREALDHADGRLQVARTPEGFGESRLDLRFVWILVEGLLQVLSGRGMVSGEHVEVPEHGANNGRTVPLLDAVAQQSPCRFEVAGPGQLFRLLKLRLELLWSEWR